MRNHAGAGVALCPLLSLQSHLVEDVRPTDKVRLLKQCERPAQDAYFWREDPETILKTNLINTSPYAFEIKCVLYMYFHQSRESIPIAIASSS
jgi:hypothetical protein